MAKKVDIKKRNWTALIYPESAPEDWIEFFQLKGLVFALSPLHDKDINPDGTPKKPHYHIIIVFGNPTTFNNVKNILAEINQPIPMGLESVGAMYKYFTHKDHPDKYQYDEKLITHYNGFNVNDVLNSFEVMQALRDIQMIINDKHIIEYADLIDYLYFEGFWDLHSVATNKTIFINSYIKSKKAKLTQALIKSNN